MKKRLVGLAALVAITIQSPVVTAAVSSDDDSPSAYSEVANKRIDLNSASIEQLTSLPGVGNAKAQAIIKYREEIGPFLEVAQLTQVKGIGEKMLSKIQQYVEVKP